jgi:Nucleotidyl transferase AbiEii toxin, Type IV TA system
MRFDAVTFKYPLHNQILRILASIDHDFFLSCETYFGGGTMLVLAYGEYRLSRDIDFLCPYGEPFSRLRRGIYDRGYDAIFRADRDSRIQFPREIRTDRDAIRFAIAIDDTLIKFEIVAEGRIGLNPPSQPSWSPVACLDLVDQVTEKLMANGDRWADASTNARDLIDLARLKLVTDFPAEAIAKAEAVYPCIEPLKRSILDFQAKPDYRSRCYENLQVDSPRLVVDGLDRLAAQFLLLLTDRQHQEIPANWLEFV